MPTREIKAVVDWLIDGARSAPLPQQVLAQLSERLVACGIPLWRVAVFVRTLHPNVMGRRFIWRPGCRGRAYQRRRSSFSKPNISATVRSPASIGRANRSGASWPIRTVPRIFRSLRIFAPKR